MIEGEPVEMTEVIVARRHELAGKPGSCVSYLQRVQRRQAAARMGARGAIVMTRQFRPCHYRRCLAAVMVTHGGCTSNRRASVQSVSQFIRSGHCR